MDWLLHHKLDAGQKASVFKYEPSHSTIIKVLAGAPKPEVKKLDSAKIWDDWFSENGEPRRSGHESGLITVLAGRALQRPYCSGQTSIRCLPFSEETFKKLAKHFFIHEDIMRVIDRGDFGVFTAAEVDVAPGRPAIVYNCRSSNLWEDDLALSVTHFPDEGFTYAVVYGCTEKVEREILRRLASVASVDASQTAHPMFLVGLFAELEMSRLNTQVKETALRLEVKLSGLQEGWRGHEHQTSDITNLWLDAIALRDGLSGWRAQLQEMAYHLGSITRDRGSVPWTATQFDVVTANRPSAQRVGIRMLNRIRDMTNEIDDNIRQCQTRAEGALAAEMVGLVRSMRRDGETMQRPANVSVLFLPFLATTALFSTQFFNWFPKEGEAVVSPYVWVLVAAVVGFSLVCVLYFAADRILRARRARPETIGYISVV